MATHATFLSSKLLPNISEKAPFLRTNCRVTNWGAGCPDGISWVIQIWISEGTLKLNNVVLVWRKYIWPSYFANSLHAPFGMLIKVRKPELPDQFCRQLVFWKYEATAQRHPLVASRPAGSLVLLGHSFRFMYCASSKKRVPTSQWLQVTTASVSKQFSSRWSRRPSTPLVTLYSSCAHFIPSFTRTESQIKPLYDEEKHSTAELHSSTCVLNYVCLCVCVNVVHIVVFYQCRYSVFVLFYLPASALWTSDIFRVREKKKREKRYRLPLRCVYSCLGAYIAYKII